MKTQLWWFVARASGLVAWGVLSASMLWGLAVTTRLTRTKPPRGWLLDLHRFLGALAVIFTALHLTGLWLDSFVHFGLTELFVPLASSWHPVAVAWGIVALYVLIAVEGSALLMRRLPGDMWRKIHRASFALFVLATIHGLSAGTDTKHHPIAWYAAIVVAIAVFVLWLVKVRALARRTPARTAAGPTW